MKDLGEKFDIQFSHDANAEIGVPAVIGRVH